MEISEIRISGFPVEVNRKINNGFDESTRFMRDMFTDKGGIIGY